MLRRLFALRKHSANKVLVLNCGSSSVKYSLFNEEDNIVKGSVDNIGLKNCFHSTTLAEAQRHLGESVTYNDAIRLAIDSVLDKADGGLRCVGHRVVHGGTALTNPTVINAAVLDELGACSVLAPLHNPSNITGIKIASSLLANVPQVACFDTAFHSSMPKKAYTYAIPKEIADKERIRRYGFHGLSYAYITSVVKAERMIVLHLGSGCSAAAIVKGKVIDTTMGMTPMEGLVMSTRSGTIDPGVILYLGQYMTGNLHDLGTLLNKKSGLLGLSGITSDMKALLTLTKSRDPQAIAANEAVEAFVYSVQKHVGQLVAALEFAVDAIVFTGGIGENSTEIRHRVLKAFTNYGVLLDGERNVNVPQDGVISAPTSSIVVLAIKTNEELQIARDSLSVIQSS